MKKQLFLLTTSALLATGLSPLKIQAAGHLDAMEDVEYEEKDNFLSYDDYPDTGDNAAAHESTAMAEDELEALFNETPLGVDYTIHEIDVNAFFNQCSQASSYDEKVTIIKRMLEKISVDAFVISSSNTTNQSLLTKAIDTDATDVAKILIECGANVNKKNCNDSGTPLLAAIATGNNTIATLLIKHGADVNMIDTIGSTPLMEAIALGNTTLVTFLILHDADVNAKNKYSKTPLIYAAETLNNNLVKLLIMKGARYQQRDFNTFSDSIKKTIETTHKVKQQLEDQDWFPENLVNSPAIPLAVRDIRSLVTQYTHPRSHETILDHLLGGDAHLQNLIGEYAAEDSFSNELALHQGIIQEINRRQAEQAAIHQLNTERLTQSAAATEIAADEAMPDNDTNDNDEESARPTKRARLH